MRGWKDRMDRKKELKMMYKEAKRPMGIFQIKNGQTGKILVGSSNNLEAMKNREMFMLKTGAHFNRELQQDYNQYGADAFTFEVLETLKLTDNPFQDTKKELEELEEKWLKTLQPYDENGYNKRKGT